MWGVEFEFSGWCLYSHVCVRSTMHTHTCVHTLHTRTHAHTTVCIWTDALAGCALPRAQLDTVDLPSDGRVVEEEEEEEKEELLTVHNE